MLIVFGHLLSVHNRTGDDAFKDSAYTSYGTLQGPKTLDRKKLSRVLLKNHHPGKDWLNYVVTGKARTNIRHFLKSLQDAEAESLGKRLLQQSLNQIHGKEYKAEAHQIESVLEKYQLDSYESLRTEIGLGNRTASLVAQE